MVGTSLKPQALFNKEGFFRRPDFNPSFWGRFGLPEHFIGPLNPPGRVSKSIDCPKEGQAFLPLVVDSFYKQFFQIRVLAG